MLEGALEHRDTLGNGSVIRPGDLQRMSAGRGVQHSEFNPSASDRSTSSRSGSCPTGRASPRPTSRPLPRRRAPGTLRLLASKDGRAGSIAIHQDANVHGGSLARGDRLAWRSPPGRHLWLQVARGRLEAGGTTLEAGDGAFTSDPGDLLLEGLEPAEVLLFDLA